MGRRVILGAALAALALAFFAVSPKPTGGPPLRDFEAYYAAGVTASLDGDPYGRDVWRVEREVPGVIATRDELLPFVGPPFGLPLWRLLGTLPWSNAVLVWDAVMAVSLAVLGLGAMALAPGSPNLQEVTAVFVLIAGFGPLTSGVALGQAAVLACAATVMALVLLQRGPLLGALGAALVAALQPNLALALAARLGERRALIAVGGAAALALTGSALELGSGGLGHYARTLAQQVQAERFIAIQTTPGAVARALGASPSLAGSIAVTLAFVTLAILVLQYASRRYDPISRVALASAALPLALPFAHEHDFAVAFLPAVLCLRAARGSWWLAAAFATLAVGVDWLGLAQRPTGVAATSLLTFAAALAIVVLDRAPLRVAKLAPGASLALVAAVGSWAAAHPLPTWPQTLPLDFHVPPMLGAAATWHLEQVASGTATLDPRWAALRLAPLVGSAALWAVASSVMRLPRRERPKTAQNREATFLVQEPVKRPIRKPDVHAPS